MMEPGEEREQVVNGPQTNIAGDVYGPVLSGEFEGGVNVYSRSHLEELHDYIARAVAGFETRMYQHLRPSSTSPTQPYKFLYAFEVEDAPIFFGRDAAVKDLHKNVLENRITVLHAKSGMGKTSLLKAGLSTLLIREGRLPIYTRTYADPTFAVKQAIAPSSIGPWPELLERLSLHEFLGLVCKHLSRETQELVVILDQFEEFFVFWTQLDRRRFFVKELASCYEDTRLPIRFIISIRGDYFTQLATFQVYLPHIFHNEYYLDTLTYEEAQIAITGPVTKLDQAVIYEPALLDTLLNDLMRGGMELPHLQIICVKLYKTVLDKGDKIVSLAVYKQLGGAESILGGYLNEVLAKQLPAEQVLAKEILKELVSSEATKRILSYSKLETRFAIEPGNLKSTLAYLVNERLLHRTESQDGPLYEMAHEYLLEQIKEWIDPQNLAFKHVQELFEREVVNWRIHKTLIPKDRLEILHSYREKMKDITDEVRYCLSQSAMQAGFSFDWWPEIMIENQDEYLWNILLETSDSQVRQAGFITLGKFLNMPEIASLGAGDQDVRWGVINSFREKKDLSDISLKVFLVSLKDVSYYIRLSALAALGDFQDYSIVEHVANVLSDENPKVRLEAMNLLTKGL